MLPARRLADAGLAAWVEVIKRGYEGLVAKDPESTYVPGRSLRWLKVKQPAYREKERGSTSRRRRTGYSTADFYQIFTRRGLTHGPP